MRRPGRRASASAVRAAYRRISAFVELSCASSGSSAASSSPTIRWRQHLAELDAPLVERVDAPDRALREDAVLVERDELAERRGRQALERGACSSAGCPRTCGAGRASPASPSARDLLGRLPERERLALREDVREQQVVVPAERVRASARTRSGRTGSGASPGGSAGRRSAGRSCRARPRRPGRSRSRRAASRASRTCRSTPSSAAGGRPGSARGTGRTASRRSSAAPKKSAYQTTSRPISTGRLRSSGAVRKCSSTAWKPSSSSRKPSGPIAIIVESPIAESIE